jgi:DNA-binding MarR family transcriptional regulator
MDREKSMLCGTGICGVIMADNSNKSVIQSLIKKGLVERSKVPATGKYYLTDAGEKEKGRLITEGS